jgi:L-amino acid N-acyltransferase YncA
VILFESMENLEIRHASESDREAIWEIFHAIVARADTYVFDPSVPKEEALAYWMSPSNEKFVAILNDEVVGTYILRPISQDSDHMSRMPLLW